MPKHDGVLGFEWRDPKSQREVLDGWPPGILAGALDRDDAMNTPVATDVALQTSLAPTLTGYQDAPVTQSAENLAQDRKLGLHPPPSAPARA
jgi:hypothetical protein